MEGEATEITNPAQITPVKAIFNGVDISCDEEHPAKGQIVDVTHTGGESEAGYDCVVMIQAHIARKVFNLTQEEINSTARYNNQIVGDNADVFYFEANFKEELEVVTIH